MAKNESKAEGAPVAELPTGLKALISACEAEVPSFKYSFQKKDALIGLLTQARGGATQEVVDVVPVKEEVKKEKAAPKKAAKKAKVVEEEKEEEVVEVDDSIVGDDKVEITEVEMPEVDEDDKADPKNAAPAKKDSPDKKAAKKDDAKADNGKKKAGASPDDISEIKKRADVALILAGGEKKDYTKSDKIRKLYQKAKLPIGNIAKVLDIHYSFAYCVVDAYRKGLLDEKKGEKK